MSADVLEDANGVVAAADQQKRDAKERDRHSVPRFRDIRRHGQPCPTRAEKRMAFLGELLGIGIMRIWKPPCLGCRSLHI